EVAAPGLDRAELVEMVEPDQECAVAAGRDAEDRPAAPVRDRAEVRVDPGGQLVRERGLPVAAGPPVQVLRIGVAVPIALRGDQERVGGLGCRTVALLVDWLNDAEAPPLRRATGAEMRERLSGPAPDGPEPMGAILEGLARDVLPFASRVHHPAFFAFIPGSG